MQTSVCHVSSVHPRDDHRIFEKELGTLLEAGYATCLVVADGQGDDRNQGISIIDVGRRSRSRLSRIAWTAPCVLLKARRERATFVHLHDPELLLYVWLFLGSKAKLIYDAHEDLSVQVMHKRWIPKRVRPIVGVIAGRLVDILVRLFCDGLVSATPQIQSKFSLEPNLLVRNFPKPDLFGALKESERKVPGNIQVVYVGGVSHPRGIVEMIDAIVLAREKHPFSFHVAGPLEGPAIASLLEPEFVKYHGILGRKEIVSLLSTSDISLVLLHPVPAYLESLPVKMFEYMAAGLPMIASDFPVWNETLAGSDCAVFCDPFDSREIAGALVELAEDMERRAAMGSRARLAFVEKFNWEREGESLLELYNAIK